MSKNRIAFLHICHINIRMAGVSFIALCDSSLNRVAAVTKAEAAFFYTSDFLPLSTVC